MSFRKYPHGIYCVDAQYIQPGLAAAYLLVHENQVCIIETGTSLSMPDVLQAVESLGLGAQNVAYVIPTHIHLDHAGGAGALMAACPNAELIIHPRGAAHMINPEKLILGTIAVYGQARFEQLYGEIVPIPESRVTIAEDGFTLDLGGRVLEFIDTPGHALHHFCVYDAHSASVFTGDTFGIAYPHLITPQGPFIFATTTPTQFDPDALQNSINRIVAKQPRHINLTHFGQIECTAEITRQLKDSVSDQAQLAQAFLGQPEDRLNKLREALLDQFVNRILKQDGQKGREYYEKQFAADTLLNAQGLDVWLSRLEKKRA